MADLDATVDWIGKNGGNPAPAGDDGLFAGVAAPAWLYAAHSSGRASRPPSPGTACCRARRRNASHASPLDLAKDLKAPVLGLYAGKIPAHPRHTGRHAERLGARAGARRNCASIATCGMDSTPITGPPTTRGGADAGARKLRLVPQPRRFEAGQHDDCQRRAVLATRAFRKRPPPCATGSGSGRRGLSLLQHRTDGRPDLAAHAESACIAGSMAPDRPGSWPHIRGGKKSPLKFQRAFTTWRAAGAGDGAACLRRRAIVTEHADPGHHHRVGLGSGTGAVLASTTTLSNWFQPLAPPVVTQSTLDSPDWLRRRTSAKPGGIVQGHRLAGETARRVVERELQGHRRAHVIDVGQIDRGEIEVAIPMRVMVVVGLYPW